MPPQNWLVPPDRLTPDSALQSFENFIGADRGRHGTQLPGVMAGGRREKRIIHDRPSIYDRPPISDLGPPLVFPPAALIAEN